MKIEIVEFYPFSKEEREKHKIKKNRLGTLHIYICDLDVDIRGIIVEKIKGGVFIIMPHFYGWEGGKRVRYPIFTPTQPEIYQQLVKTIQYEAAKAMKKGR